MHIHNAYTQYIYNIYTLYRYEGTGRALSLKLIQQLRSAQGQAMVQAAKTAGDAVIGAKSKKGLYILLCVV